MAKQTKRARSELAATKIALRRIRKAVSAGRVEYTSHALEEMDDDALTENDARSVLLRGDLVAELTADPRGVRYVFRSSLGFGADVVVVCREMPSGVLRVITVYMLD